MKQKTRIIIYILIAIAVVIIGTIVILSSRTAKPIPESHLDLGRIYLADLSYDKAILEFKEAIRIDPKDPEPYIELANVYIEIDDVPSAIETLEEGLKETGDDRIYDMLDELRMSSEGTTDNESEFDVTNVPSETSIPIEAASEEETTASTANLVEVPDLSGLSEEEAKKLCEDNGFKYSVSYAGSNDIEKGFVIGQTIPAGASVAEGISIPFSVSEGRKLEYDVELMEEYTKEWDSSVGEYGGYKNVYNVKSDYDFSSISDVTYPYICQHGSRDGEASVAVNDPYYDSDYKGEMYYSIETENSSIKLSTRYYYVAQFSEEMAFFQRDYKKEKNQTSCIRGYINTRGKEIFSYKYVNSSIVGGNGSGHSVGFADSSVVPDYNLFDMHYGYAAYNTENSDAYGEKYGIVDKNGNVLVKPKYESVVSSSDGIIRVGIRANDTYGEKYGYVDTNDNIIVKCKYDIAGEFTNGVAVVGYLNQETNDYKKGVINKKGKLVIPCQYDYCLIENNGIIIAFNTKYDETTYSEKYDFYCYDLNGKLLFGPSPFICTGTNTGCPTTYGESNDRIIIQGDDGNVYLYDLNGKLINKTSGTIQKDLMLFNGGGNGPFIRLFDPTGIIYLGNNTYMDKDGNVYSEHPYGLAVYDTVEKVYGYDDVYKFYVYDTGFDTYSYYKISK
ncbi:MAG: WG repeat-containing protein [Lachnospiraceae bacterium]|nr:WG repeat-containing protein [Lachnospiraceae bacterium]